MDSSLFPFEDYDQTYISFNKSVEKYCSLKVFGPDAKRFLNGQLTSNVDELELLTFHESARLDRTGRVKSFFILIHNDNNSYIAFGRKRLINNLKEDLDKYIIMDDVETLVQEHDYKAIISYSKRDSGFSGMLGGLPVYLDDAPVEAQLRELSTKEYRDLEILRGIPALEINVDIDQLVTDTILNLGSVSHSKGCYLGQETVSKIESRRGGAYFPVLLEMNNSELSFEKGSDLSTGSEKIGRLLEGVELKEDKFLLVSAPRKYRVSNMKIIIEGKHSALVHYLPLGGIFEKKLWLGDLYQKAVEKFHSVGAKEALPLFKKILKIEPSHEDTLETIGVIYGQLGEYEKGLAQMDSVLEANPESIMAHTNKSLFFMKLGKIEEAEEEKAQATLKSFSHFGKKAQDKRLKEERVEKERIEIERREGMFRQVLEIDSEDALANYGMGDIYYSKGLWDKAVSSLENVIKSDPKYSVAYLLLGKALIKKEKNNEAVEILTTGIEVASSRGDLMPANEMQQLLNKLCN